MSFASRKLLYFTSNKKLPTMSQNMMRSSCDEQESDPKETPTLQSLFLLYSE